MDRTAGDGFVAHSFLESHKRAILGDEGLVQRRALVGDFVTGIVELTVSRYLKDALVVEKPPPILGSGSNPTSPVP